MSEFDTVPLDSVRINGGTQSRVELDQTVIAEYADAIRLGTDLPPVVMFFDGANFWLADGFHRFHAHRQAGAMEIAADIRTGAQRDAVLFSVGANASHGLRRTNDDKRRAVETLLRDPEWTTWSNNAIAKACSVSDKTVAACRAEYLRNSEDSHAASQTRIVERNGATYEQNTSKIGKTQAVAEQPAPAAVPASAPGDDTLNLGVTNSAPSTSPSLEQFINGLDDGHVPDLEEVNSRLEAEIARLRDEIVALKAEVARLGGTDQAARIEALCLEREEMRSLAASHRSDFLRANDQVVKFDKLLKRLRRMAGVDTNGEIERCIVRATAGA